MIKISNFSLFLVHTLTLLFLYIISSLTVFNIPYQEFFTSFYSILIFFQTFFFIFIIILITYISLVVGVYLFEIQFSHKYLMRIILFAFSIFLIQLYLEWLWIMVFKGKYTGDDYREFVLFSLSWVIGVKQIPIYLLNLCGSINLFEVTYWILLAIGLKKIMQESSFMKRLGFVLMTYGLGWLSWVVFQTYMDITTYY